MKRLIPFIILLLILVAAPAAAQSHELAAEHEHAFGGCRGTLVITPEKIEYKTRHDNHARSWPYLELQQIKIASKTGLELLTYEDQRRLAGRDRSYRFKLLEGEVTAEIGALLLSRASRPVVTSVSPVAEERPRFEVPVKHLHNFGGCAGVLRIFADHVSFSSTDKPEHSRFWRFADIQNFSQSERFRFEIAVSEAGLGGPKAYNFQLKADLPAQAYDYLWRRVYPSKFRHDESTAGLGEPEARKH